jgi:hypothetical protein
MGKIKCICILMLFFLGMVCNLKAQHCPWEGTNLTVIEIVDENGNIIHDLKVTYSSLNRNKGHLLQISKKRFPI